MSREIGSNSKMVVRVRGLLWAACCIASVLVERSGAPRDGARIAADTLTAMPAANVAKPLRTATPLVAQARAADRVDVARGDRHWQATWDPATGVPRQIWGSGIAAPGANGDAAIAEAARARDARRASRSARAGRERRRLRARVEHERRRDPQRRLLAVRRRPSRRRRADQLLVQARSPVRDDAPRRCRTSTVASGAHAVGELARARPARCATRSTLPNAPVIASGDDVVVAARRRRRACSAIGSSRRSRSTAAPTAATSRTSIRRAPA